MHLYILDCSIQVVLARMLRELMNQLRPIERLASLRVRARAGQDAAGAKKSAVAATKASTFEGWGLQNRRI